MQHSFDESLELVSAQQMNRCRQYVYKHDKARDFNSSLNCSSLRFFHRNELPNLPFTLWPMPCQPVPVPIHCTHLCGNTMICSGFESFCTHSFACWSNTAAAFLLTSCSAAFLFTTAWPCLSKKKVPLVSYSKSDMRSSNSVLEASYLLQAANFCLKLTRACLHDAYRTP